MTACPVCGGCRSLYLGKLGPLRHYRCRTFGADWSRVVKPPRPKKGKPK